MPTFEKLRKSRWTKLDKVSFPFLLNFARIWLLFYPLELNLLNFIQNLLNLLHVLEFMDIARHYVEKMSITHGSEKFQRKYNNFPFYYKYGNLKNMISLFIHLFRFIAAIVSSIYGWRAFGINDKMSQSSFGWLIFIKITL